MGILRARRNLSVVALGLFCGWGAMAEADVARTTHNLSASGPGTVTSEGTGEVCVFCHTPHHANPSRALWNRQLPGTIYQLYRSSTLEAAVSQPTGSSRLCLSCHDGTVALGLLRVPPSGGAPGLAALRGRASLGTDLSNDHPISFVYDARLAAQQGRLALPDSLPRQLPLDETRQLQCTTCHNPHDDTWPHFLRMDTRYSALCTACHILERWTEASHATSRASWSGHGAPPEPDGGVMTVAERGCESCHQPHGAAHGPHLLADAQESATCLACHNGAVAARNLGPDLLKPSAHPVTASEGAHDPREDPRTMPRHVACTDCHNPHQARAGAALPGGLSGPLQGVSGVDLSGMPVDEARSEYEVCLKCHGIQDQAMPGIVRQDNTRNVRLEIDPSNASYHPVAAVGKQPTLQGLQPGVAASSLIHCTDCHASDEVSAGGVRPRGPHGSRFPPLLAREYQQGDPVRESATTAALCYTCHARDALLSRSRFPHEDHLRELGGASCAVCHDAHGSRRNQGLINFMLRDMTGNVVVSPNRQGALEFRVTGTGHGECSLSCHGDDHLRRGY